MDGSLAAVRGDGIAPSTVRAPRRNSTTRAASHILQGRRLDEENTP